MKPYYLPRILIITVFALCVTRQSIGELESTLDLCCLLGGQWAQQTHSCDGFTAPVPGVKAEHQTTCLSAQEICCIRTHRSRKCEAGKETARLGQECSVLVAVGGEAHKDCCEGCKLGLVTASIGLSCSFREFAFGTPWDEAFYDCCLQSAKLTGGADDPSERRCESNNPCSQKCTDTGFAIKCSCYAGFKLAADLRNCEDINECEMGTDTCRKDVEQCKNTVGGFQCVPKSNVEGPGRMPGQQCRPGYAFNAATQTCDDVDECLLGTHTCKSATETCTNIIGSFSCVPRSENMCPPGFKPGDAPGSCLDVDECAEKIHGCNLEEEYCLNVYNGYKCQPLKDRQCPAGYKWNQNTAMCEDVDECDEKLDNCDPEKEQCRNVVGAYECDIKCKPGYSYNPILQSCIDFDECNQGTHQCPAGTKCVNSDGGYDCHPQVLAECPAGYKPAPPVPGVPPSCIDVDECEEQVHACNHLTERCINGIGSYECLPIREASRRCSFGFRYDEESQQCADINECQRSVSPCSLEYEVCVNTNGSYTCVPLSTNHVARIQCPSGFQLNDRTHNCEDINECLENIHGCSATQQCANDPGGYRCLEKEYLKCPHGYKPDPTQTKCVDIDECEEGTHTCNLEVETCENVLTTYHCIPKAVQCPRGYRINRRTNDCDDINECEEKSHDCNPATQYCVNTRGTFQCHSIPTTTVPKCGSGYARNPETGVCEDIDECEEDGNPCSENYVCENAQGSYRCICPKGFIKDPVTKECSDVNECQVGQHNCGSGQRCDNTIGSYTCFRVASCGTGYTLNAENGECEDDDECLLGTHNCGVGYMCRNTAGSFRCDRITCPRGHRLLADGTCHPVTCPRGMEVNSSGECVDINECARSSPCRSNQRCVNTVGSFRCQNVLSCGGGYEINEQGNQCIDIDECATGTHECKSNQICKNRQGSYSCECPTGYTMNTRRECEDVDECVRFRGQVCSSNSECQNTPGSYVCSCKTGFKNVDDDRSCVDVDECADTPNLCQHNCVNIWGSYQCTCNQGFTLSPDKRSCQDIDECALWEGKGNLCIGICVNEPGSYSCSCPDGYVLGSDKRTCQDVNECEEQNVCKGENEVCLNTRGGFKCNLVECPPNYIRDRDYRNRCKRTSLECRRGDAECLKQPISYSFNFITFVSKIPIPPTGHLDIFTMRGPRFTFTSVQFDLQMKDVFSPLSVPLATRDHFQLRRTAFNEAMISVVKPLTGPQDIELELAMKMYHNGLFGGIAIARLFVFVTQYEY